MFRHDSKFVDPTFYVDPLSEEFIGVECCLRWCQIFGTCRAEEEARAANAEAEAAKIIASAKEAIEIEKKEALAEIKAEVAQLSISVAEKLLKEELSDAKKDASFVNGLLGEVNLK